MKLNKRLAMLCNAIAIFVARFADSNGNHFIVRITSGIFCKQTNGQ